MARYPIATRSGKVGEFFDDLLKLHLDLAKSPLILDPTCGEKHLWEGIAYTEYPRRIEGQPQVVFRDADPTKSWIAQDVRKMTFTKLFDAVIFDPPYFFGQESSSDPRQNDYGGYHQSLADLHSLIMDGTERCFESLKPGGKFILKCADQYHVPSRKFYPLHYDWMDAVQLFMKLVDIQIYVYHRVSPTAYQVKARPCSVINHTYFLVFEKAMLVRQSKLSTSLPDLVSG